MKASFFLALTFFFVSLFLFIFSDFLSSPFDSITRLFSYPRAGLYSFAHAQGRDSETDKLISENKKLREQLSQMHFLKTDNDALRSQFQDTTVSSEKLLPAKIIGFKGSILNPSGFILDQGEKSSIKKGMAVVLGHDLVGKIGKVTSYYSEVDLPKNKNFSTLAVSTDNNAPGILVGQEDFMLFGDVVITDTISKNETVITKGDVNSSGVGIPPGLIIGKIKTINNSETKPFQSAVVESLLDFKKLTTVFVITK